MNDGWIKVHRKMIKWEWFDDPNTFRLFMYLLFTVNFEDKKWRGITVKKGQLITSYDHLSKGVGLSVQQTRTSLDKLKSTGEVTHKTNNKYGLLTVINYKQYQMNNTPINKQITNEQQTNNKQITTTKEREEGKERKEVVSKDTAKAEYGSSEVNDVLKGLKTITGREDFKESQKYQRFYGKHFVGLLKKIGKEEFRRRLDIILGDDFKEKNCNSLKYLYGEVKSSSLFSRPKKDDFIVPKNF